MIIIYPLVRRRINLSLEVLQWHHIVVCIWIVSSRTAHGRPRVFRSFREFPGVSGTVTAKSKFYPSSRRAHHNCKFAARNANTADSSLVGFAFGPRFCGREGAPHVRSHNSTNASSPNGRPVLVASASRGRKFASSKPCGRVTPQVSGLQSACQTSLWNHSFAHGACKCTAALDQGQSAAAVTIAHRVSLHVGERGPQVCHSSGQE
jgi:hypothetical protein